MRQPQAGVRRSGARRNIDAEKTSSRPITLMSPALGQRLSFKVKMEAFYMKGELFYPSARLKLAPLLKFLLLFRFVYY